MTTQIIEYKVWEIEHIKIIVEGCINTYVLDYTYKKAMPGKCTVKKLMETRIDPLLQGYNYIILDGDLNEPHGNMLLKNLRNSYKKVA